MHYRKHTSVFSDVHHADKLNRRRPDSSSLGAASTAPSILQKLVAWARSLVGATESIGVGEHWFQGMVVLASGTHSSVLLPTKTNAYQKDAAAVLVPVVNGQGNRRRHEVDRRVVYDTKAENDEMVGVV